MKFILIILSLLTLTAKSQQQMFHMNNKVTSIVLDADVQKFVTKVTNNGGFLTTTEKNAVNAMVLSLKSNSLWTKFTAIYPMVGGTKQSCIVNLKDTTQFNLSIAISANQEFNYTASGMNKPNVLVNTTISPLANLSATTGHLSFYSRTNTTAGAYDMGSSDDAGVGVKASVIITKYSNSTGYAQYGNVTASSSVSDSRGFFMSNFNSGTLDLFKNGSSIGSASGSPSLSAQQIYLFAVNAGGAESFVSGRQCAFASIGQGFTTGEASTFYTIIQTFQTSLVRQI